MIKKILKIIFIFLCALFIPRCFLLLYAPTNSLIISKNTNLNLNKYKLGLENIPKSLLNFLKFKKLKIGLITNQTGIDQHGNRNIDLFLKEGLDIRAIFAPEHGISGKIEAGEKVIDSIDKKTKIPIISLYVAESQFKKFTVADLKDIDVFIFDMQDSGMRHYTYISILYKIMEVAEEFNKKVIVLDRPNPLGIIMEGPLVEPGFISFVSIASIPLRHGMTIGEIGQYFNKFCLKKEIDLIIIPIKNYKRTMGLTKMLSPLSPNITSLESCYGYSFLGIIEAITPFEVGYGSKNAFQYIMLPENLNFPISKWYEVRNILHNNNIHSKLLKYVRNDGKRFVGLKIDNDPNTYKINFNNFSCINIILDLLIFFKNAGIDFSYRPIFNKLAGTDELKKVIEGKITREKFAEKTNKNLEDFFNKIKDLLIYDPLPKIVKLKK